MDIKVVVVNIFLDTIILHIQTQLYRVLRIKLRVVFFLLLFIGLRKRPFKFRYLSRIYREIQSFLDRREALIIYDIFIYYLMFVLTPPM